MSDNPFVFGPFSVRGFELMGHHSLMSGYHEVFGKSQPCVVAKFAPFLNEDDRQSIATALNVSPLGNQDGSLT